MCSQDFVLHTFHLPDFQGQTREALPQTAVQQIAKYPLRLTESQVLMAIFVCHVASEKNSPRFLLTFSFSVPPLCEYSIQD